jgi:uncharacterized membrane protein YcaP (DUF421 family)
VKDLLAAPSEIGIVVLRTVVVYFFVLIGLRLRGKHEVGHLSPLDFTLILLVANAVQNAMVGPSTSLLAGLVAAATLMVVNALFGRFVKSNRRLERLVRSEPRVLVSHGQVNEKNMREERVTREELEQSLREGGCLRPSECRLAVLEVDGTISVIPKKDS